ncbi:MAG TPA: 50S ribosomal protein L4 [Candidatus Acidoferrales bacterium]|nr:50S ribosomal protein L4 [Candidatus Acidoferrales bacterium]
MKIAIKNIAGKNQGELEVKFPLVEGGKGTQAVHDAVVAYQAAQRSGTANTKNVGEVAGTNKKPWRQKGTGRARAGSFRSPLWVGGGVVFGPRPRDFAKKVSKKTRSLALRKALSERLKAGDVIVVDELKLSSPKTKEFIRVISALELKGTTLVISTGADKNLTLASRNLPGVALATSDSLNTYDILRPDKLLFTKSAFEKVEARLGKE